MANLIKITGCEFYRKRIVCLANIFTVAGTEEACTACAPSMDEIRKVMQCSEVAPGLFLSAVLSPEKKARVEAAIEERLKAQAFETAHFD